MASKLIDAGADYMASWEVWDGEPPIERQRYNNPTISKLDNGHWLLEWFW